VKRTRVAPEGVAAVSLRGDVLPPPEGGIEGKERERERERESMQRERWKEKLTPDDAGADKTTNDNVCRALARLFLTFRDNLMPRLLPPSPFPLPALLGDFIRRISSLCM